MFLGRIAVLGLMLLAAPLARAQLSIEITGAGGQRIPIAVVTFAGESVLGASISSIVISRTSSREISVE